MSRSKKSKSLNHLKVCDHPKSARKLKRKIWFKRFGVAPYAPCCYCDDMITFAQSTIEHLVALGEGGTNDENNLDIACKDCNKNKGIEISQRVNKKFISKGLNIKIEELKKQGLDKKKIKELIRQILNIS